MRKRVRSAGSLTLPGIISRHVATSPGPVLSAGARRAALLRLLLRLPLSSPGLSSSPGRTAPSALVRLHGRLFWCAGLLPAQLLSHRGASAAPARADRRH